MRRRLGPLRRGLLRRLLHQRRPEKRHRARHHLLSNTDPVDRHRLGAGHRPVRRPTADRSIVVLSLDRLAYPVRRSASDAARRIAGGIAGTFIRSSRSTGERDCPTRVTTRSEWYRNSIWSFVQLALLDRSEGGLAVHKLLL